MTPQRAMPCAATRVAVAAALAVCLLLCCAPVPAAGAKGGATCSRDIHCGWPAANVDTLREDAASITGGTCVDGACNCAGNHGCGNCFVQELPGAGTTRDTGTSPPRTIDLCDMAWGGGVCTSDEHCGNGLCLDKKCVCYKDWGCAYCSLDLAQDVVDLGAQCGMYVSGHGECVDGSNECGVYGVCRDGKCQCGAGYGCAHCEHAKSALIAGTASCPCAGVNCNGHGACHNGACVCSDGYAGPNCDFDPCEGNDCSGHGTCSRATGKCTCEAGFGGDDCSQGGGTCDEDKHCGIFGEQTYGGQCNDDGECVCWEGYTCPDCAGIGEECSQARGGGPCSTEWDCGVFGAGFGGQCVFSDPDKYWMTVGRCRCWPGYTCQQCDTHVSHVEGGGSCPEVVSPNAGARAAPGLVTAVLQVACVVVGCAVLALA